MASGTIKKLGKCVELKRVSHTTQTANKYELVTNITLQHDAIVKFHASYSNGYPLGISVGTSESPYYAIAKAEQRNDESNESSISLTTILPSGTYYVFTQYSNTTLNTVDIWEYVI